MELAAKMPAITLATATAANTSKIVLYVDDLPTLERYEVLCQNYATVKIIDEGLTEIVGPDVVVLGVGPISFADGRKLFQGLKLVR